MRRIKQKERDKGGERYCETCRAIDGRRVRAVWVEMGRTYCDEHKPAPDDGYMSEADYQTWGRL